MKCSVLRKKIACTLSVLILGVNSKAEDTKQNSLFQNENNKLDENKINSKFNSNSSSDSDSDSDSKLDKIKQEIIHNINKKNINDKNISELKIDTYIPEIPKKETEKNLASRIINFSINFDITMGIIFGIKSVINILCQRLRHGKHIKYSQDYKQMLRYLHEFENFDPSELKFKKISLRFSKDKKAALYIINSEDYENKEIKIENAPENIIIFCNGDKNINISKLNKEIKRLFIISKNCVQICNAPKIEFFYAGVSSLIIPKNNKNCENNENSQLKEAILNIQNLIIGIGEENEEYSNIIDSNELVKLLETRGLLGGKKPDNIKYKTIRASCSNNGFGKNNWFTIYKE